MTDELRDDADRRRTAARLQRPEGRPDVYVYRDDGDGWTCATVNGDVGGDHLEALRAHLPDGSSIRCIDNRPTFGDVWQVQTPDGRTGRYLTRWSRL